MTGRIHARHPRDWTLNASMPRLDVTAMGSASLAFITLPRPPVELAMQLTLEEAKAAWPLVSERAASVVMLPHGIVQMSGIRVSQEESRAITGGADPLEVLLGHARKGRLTIRRLSDEEMARS